MSMEANTQNRFDRDQTVVASWPVSRGPLDLAIERASRHLLSLQHRRGFWVGELEADASVTAGYIPLMYFMTGEIDPLRKKKAVEFVLSKQLEDGLWPSYAGGPGNLDVSVQNYFALKLAGVSPDEPFMVRARESILKKGGLAKINTITKIWLALFGQYDWQDTPAIPVELMLLPDRSFFNIYDFASWSRETIVALMVILEKRYTCKVPDYARIAELMPEGRAARFRPELDRFLGWEGFFMNLDHLLKFTRKLPIKPGKAQAMKKAEQWIVDHQEADGSWGGIMLPWAYSLMALKALGRGMDDPVIRRGIQGLDGFIVEGESTMRLQPATSPVWDTAWALIALREAGISPDRDEIVRGAKWLLGEEVRREGDWQVRNRGVEPGGWAFEFENDIYPDIDDTAVVPRALLGVDVGADNDRCTEAIERALNWAVRMQCDNGGWAAFDKNNDKRILEKVPFADFMTPLDPTSPDVTAHVLELLGQVGGHERSVRRALEYIKRAQEPDGAWFGRWGVNYIYGTGLVLAGLRAVGEDMSQEYVARAVAWLESHQNSDGGWGETCETYANPDLRGTGESTASQTAWALMGLTAAGRVPSDSTGRAVGYLLSTQKTNGSWDEDQFTGTGFPRAFYLRYDLYRIYFPLLALALYRRRYNDGH